jgi:gluconolactonase
MYSTVPVFELEVHAAIPAPMIRPRESAWARVKAPHRPEVGCFLEGPAFDDHGNLFVVDIPFGRIFRLSPAGAWSLVIEYDGWPNGLKVAGDGRLLVADHKLGLVRVDPEHGAWEVLTEDAAGRPLLGLNDLTFGPDGLIYATDQGESSLVEPNGRVLRIDRNFHSEILLDCGPSPNGLVFDAGGANLFVGMTRANAVWRLPLRDGRVQRAGLAIQLSGASGPDGLALDSAGNLLVAHAPLRIERFDRDGLPIDCYWRRGTTVTNLAVRTIGGRDHIFVVDSFAGQILTAPLRD